MNKFTTKVCEELGYYVYLYIDPRNGRPFYVGKGKGNRCFTHLKLQGESIKSKTLEELRKLKLAPQIDILKYGLTEEVALIVECAAIDVLGLDGLTNNVRGHRKMTGVRDRVDEIAATLGAKPVKIIHPVLLINIRRRYRPGMTHQEIYDATRSAWKIGSQRNKAQYALPVYKRVVREVFTISGWVKGGTTMRIMDRDGRPQPRPDRWEFVGHVAEEPVRRRYLGRSVAEFYPQGAQNPIKYVNC